MHPTPSKRELGSPPVPPLVKRVEVVKSAPRVEESETVPTASLHLWSNPLLPAPHHLPTRQRGLGFRCTPHHSRSGHRFRFYPLYASPHHFFGPILRPSRFAPQVHCEGWDQCTCGGPILRRRVLGTDASKKSGTVCICDAYGGACIEEVKRCGASRTKHDEHNAPLVPSLQCIASALHDEQHLW